MSLPGDGDRGGIEGGGGREGGVQGDWRRGEGVNDPDSRDRTCVSPRTTDYE